MIQVNIDNVALTCSWVTPETSYSCCVGPGRKVAKYGGIRTVVTYGITPSFSNIQVSRRYENKLHCRLKTGCFFTSIVFITFPGFTAASS